MKLRVPHLFPFLSALVLAPAAVAAQAGPPPLSTFSIVACDPASGFWGVAVQSRVVGAGSIVPAAEADAGAIATQAAANVSFKRRGLEMLRAGRSAEEVRAAFVASDSGIADRQFAIVDRECRPAAFTGDSASAWAGHRTGPHFSVQGNILTGPEVVDAMARAYQQADSAARPFGERLLAALKAGQAAGGDRRGRQGAGMLIVKRGGGYGGGDDIYADLHVEDHVEPILELERVYGVWMSLFHPEDHFLPNGSQGIAAPAGAHVCLLRNLLARAGHGTPTEAGFCTFDEEVIGALKAFQRAQNLPVRAALTPETAARLRDAAAARPAP
ncbi:MAG TPA: DUF1028 domain-containing protein [Longimicrobium sp.]|nr:DUF1028 domain-containing protein [Longimicrobium sp.]